MAPTQYCINIDIGGFGFKNELLIPVSVNGTEHMHREFLYDVRFLYPTSFNTKCFTQYPTRTVNVKINSSYLTGIGGDKFINGHAFDCHFIKKHVVGMKEYWEYSLILVPFTTYLNTNKRSQIFDNKTAYEIVKNVLSDYNFVNVKYPKDDKPKKIPHKTQYRERDTKFISRILQEQGISFYFVMKDRQHTMQFYRSLSDYDFLQVSYKDIRLHVDARTRVMPKNVVHSSYDYNQPDKEMVASAQISNTGIVTVYEHLPGQISKRDERDSTQLIRDQVLSQRAINTGYAKRIDLTIGTRIAIEDGTSYGVIATKLEVIEPSTLSIKNHGQSVHYARGRDDLYSMDFKCMYPVDIPYKPAYPIDEPKILGSQLAKVIGSPSSYMDKEGRVQVRFPWDTNFSESKEKLWIRSTQPSASKDAGSHYKAYPGDEVVITFLDGDPDEPIITGSVYNGKNMQSIDEAGDGTQHGHKTKGGHEFLTNDTEGSQEIAMNSAKLMTLSAADKFSMSQKQWSSKTDEGVTMEQKQIDVKAAETASFAQKQIEVNSSESATHNQKKMLINSSDNSKITAGKISFVLDNQSGSTTLSGGSQTIVEGVFKVKGKAVG